MKKFYIILLIPPALFSFGIVSSLFAQTDDFSLPGRVEGTGTHFEITDSEYLNVSLQSSKETVVILESVPKTISLIIEASYIASSTELTISGLEPNTAYYKYEDSYKHEVVVTTDSSGSYSWTQDIAQAHHVWFQTRRSIIFLPSQCSTYGIWDPLTSTCTLNQDLTGSVEMASHTILDCNNHSITGDGYGIYLNRKVNVTLKNCIVSNFTYGVYLSGGWNHTLENNKIFNNHYGILLSGSNSNTLRDNIVNSNNLYGVLIDNSVNNVLTGNAMSGNKYNFFLWGAHDGFYSHQIDTTNTVDGKPVYYLLNAAGQIYDSSTDAGVIYCIFCDNVTIKDLTLTGNVFGIFFWQTHNSKIKNINANNNFVGIRLQYSADNTLSDNIISSNDSDGIALAYSDGNVLSNNTISSNYNTGVFLHGSRGNLFVDNNIHDNRHGIYLYYYSTARAYHNNFVDNYTQASTASWSSGIFDNSLPDGGNYWSDFDTSVEGCLDANDDGMCDSPYIFAGGQDRYPWTKQDGWKGPPVQEFDVGVILAEAADVSHISAPITEQLCKLIPQKIYPNGRSKEYYEDLAFCVTDYHKENSFGTIQLNFEVFDDNGVWFRTNRNESDYVGRENEFVVDAINLAASVGVDLDDKDIVIVIHGGTSYQKTYNPKRLHTLTWVPDDQPFGSPPYKILAAEDDLVGAWVHETGHIIGSLITPQSTVIPDLQPMGLATKFLFDQTKAGKWDVMAEGSWNDSGNNPPHMSSYTKEFLHWLNYDIHFKSAYGEYWINSLDTNNLGDDIFRYNLSEDANDESPEYYILEARNRGLKTWDSSLPQDKALVLYRVDTRGYPEYGYASDGYPNNSHRKINIPQAAYDIFGFNDGILRPDGETYRDYDSMVKFTARSERILGGNYEIQVGIEPIGKNFFPATFWGVILKPSSIFEDKIKIIRGIFAPIDDGDSPNISSQIGVPMRPRATISEIVEGVAIVILWLTILIFVPLSFLLLILNKIAIPRLKSDLAKKTLKIVFRIVWLTTLIGIIFFIISLVLTPIIRKIEPPPPKFPPGAILPSLFTILPDLDLHLYCRGGSHIGPNYETGEYEIQIAGAIASGDNQNSPEWILIPADITDCRFAVSSRDNQQFLAENPDIAQQIEDTADSYEVYARYIDPETAIYTSAVLSEDIQAGQELEHTIIGAEDVIVEEGKPTINTLRHEIINARQLNLIDSDGIKTSLLAKLDTADKQLKEGRTKTAGDTLNAFKNDIKAQKGKHIAEDTANLLIGDTQGVMASVSQTSTNDLSLLLADIHTAIMRLMGLLSQLINAI